MRPGVVVPLDPLKDGCTGFRERIEVVLPSAFLLERTEKALDDTILLRRVGRNEFLRETAILSVGGKVRL